MRIVMPPNGWKPRPHQQALWDYFNDIETKRFDGTGKRAFATWHRRAGKDDVALNLTAKASITRPATYWHMLPQAEQARKAIWTAVNPHTGIRRIDEAFPKDWRSNTNESEMFIRFKWGATWQVVGSDNYQNLVGTPPAGIVLSEWAKAHPGAWAYLAPILVENKGWALAITTPEGRNHAHSMFKTWATTPGYFAEMLTIADTIRMAKAAGVQPTVTLDDVEIQRREYHDLFGIDAGDALIEQEWFCSWAAAVLGAYYGKPLSQAEHAGRLCALDIVPGYPVNTAWDIGVDDPMAIWVFQQGPGWLHVIDYIEGSNEGFDYYCDWLAERGYVPDRGEGARGVDWVPHDAKQRSPTANGTKTRIQELFELKRNPSLVPDHKLMDRVNAGRRLIASPNTYFDDEYCAVGLDMLRAYKQEWDVKNRVFRKTPKHDFACFTGETHVLTHNGMRQIKDLPETGEVLTPCGLKRFRNLGMTRANAQLVEVRFKDGLTVRCTPDHLFLTASGWKSAECLTSGTISGIVRQIARLPVIDSVRPLSERADVYDIEVDDVHCFSLENGAVVHNSHGSDAWGHLAVAVEYPKVTDKQEKAKKADANAITVNDLLKRSHKENRQWT